MPTGTLTNPALAQQLLDALDALSGLHPGFPVRTGEEFLASLRAAAAFGAGRLWRREAVIGRKGTPLRIEVRRSRTHRGVPSAALELRPGPPEILRKTSAKSPGLLQVSVAPRAYVYPITITRPRWRHSAPRIPPTSGGGADHDTSDGPSRWVRAVGRRWPWPPAADSQVTCRVPSP
jgi:hypothetical protein